MTHPSSTDNTPLARLARDIIWRKYDGAPPWREPIPDAEWEAATLEAIDIICGKYKITC